MRHKLIIATILSLIAFIACVLIILGILGIIDLQDFAIGPEMGIRVLCYIAVGPLMLVALMYFND